MKNHPIIIRLNKSTNQINNCKLDTLTFKSPTTTFMYT